ncbi:hypothetical protein FRE64_16735 (plasmid) [Euhalothece natronophila Z-M001]|uniref:Uncharacterized protein n=1 Tax=Euhalothece natronophila Z-M001 TaxID=522448 RepID=A0A5B8NRG4_9CHRO|nr:hypothetical protein [Euhalothece natronophila]QDZ41618.1 hypothetical protein FRE64_16735 [Euhalothece natronophila Z-M001]
MESEIDRYPVKSLMERYRITRSVLYNRFKGLGIVPTKFGRQSYVTGEELALLDQLHDYIQAGGYITGFIQEYQFNEESEALPSEGNVERNGNNSTGTLSHNGKQLANKEAVIESPEVLEKIIETTVSSTVKAIRASNQDTLEDLETLQRIADQGWLIPTKRLAQIIDRAPSTLARKSEVNYCGFRLIRAQQEGNQSLWRVKNPK